MHASICQTFQLYDASSALCQVWHRVVTVGESIGEVGMDGFEGSVPSAATCLQAGPHSNAVRSM